MKQAFNTSDNPDALLNAASVKPARARLGAILRNHADLRREALVANALHKEQLRASHAPLPRQINKTCVHCGAAFTTASHVARYCEDCRTANARRAQKRVERDRRLMKRAHALVRNRLAQGLLPSPTLFVCADCGLPATAYDHRDYTKPLDVEPVCDTCNSLRGPGYPYNNQ